MTRCILELILFLPFVLLLLAPNRGAVILEEAIDLFLLAIGIYNFWGESQYRFCILLIMQ
jgi:hypothetical protein